MTDVQQSPDREDRRQAILTAAIEVFAERGFAEARTKQIARAAGVAEGTLYLYFEGKDDLLLTAFRQRGGAFCRAAEKLMDEPYRFPERLIEFIRLQFAGIEEDPYLASVLLVETRQSTRFFGPAVREVLRDYAAAVDSLLQSGLTDGSIRADSDIQLARRMLIGSLEEVELDWLIGQRRHSLNALAPEIARIFLSGIGAP